MHCSAVNYGYWGRSFSGSQKKIGLDVFQDGDSDVKMVYKVCHASFCKSAHPLVDAMFPVRSATMLQSFSLDEVDEKTVLKHLLSLKTNKAIGLDNILSLIHI